MHHGMLAQEVTRADAITWAWMNGMAGMPAVPVRDGDGIIRGHVLRGPGWRLVDQPCGHVLLIASPDHPALAYFPAVATDEEQP
jgi:hypothetical protein